MRVKSFITTVSLALAAYSGFVLAIDPLNSVDNHLSDARLDDCTAVGIDPTLAENLGLSIAECTNPSPIDYDGAAVTSNTPQNHSLGLINSLGLSIAEGTSSAIESNGSAGTFSTSQGQTGGIADNPTLNTASGSVVVQGPGSADPTTPGFETFPGVSTPNVGGVDRPNTGRSQTPPQPDLSGLPGQRP